MEHEAGGHLVNSEPGVFLQHAVDRCPPEKGRRRDPGSSQVDQRLAELQPGSECVKIQLQQHYADRAFPPKQRHKRPPEDRHVVGGVLRSDSAGVCADDPPLHSLLKVRFLV